MGARIEVENLRIVAGDVSLVHDIGFTVEPGQVLALIGESGSGKTTIALALMGYARRASDNQGRQGCLITASAMEMIPGDDEVGAIISRMFRRMQDLFAATIIRGQAAGEFPRDLDERAVARLLLCTIQGLRVLGKTGPSEAETAALVEIALRALG